MRGCAGLQGKGGCIAGWALEYYAHTPKFHCHDARSADPAGSSGFGLGVPGGCGRQSRSSPLAGLYGVRFQVLTPSAHHPPPTALRTLGLISLPSARPPVTLSLLVSFSCKTVPSLGTLLSPSSGHCRILFFPTAPRPQARPSFLPDLVLVFCLVHRRVHS